MKAPLLLALSGALLFALPAPAERRAALLVGESAGDQADPPLRYAESDAAAMRDALVQVGGVARADARLLRGATAPELRRALQETAAKLAGQQFGKADLLLLYVSAHASGGELHLRGTRLPLAELRRFVEQSPAGVTLLVLDTCESGAAMRAKGLTPLAGPLIQFDKPSLKGSVVIASAGPDESAYESDELGGSLFTQHLVAGLRGAADTSRDGRVTLQEAYAYAYARTVDSAAALRTGKQTPLFDLDLQGAGELVLSTPALGHARLRLEVERPGEWVLTSADGAAQASRFFKAAGPALYALDAGRYRLRSRVGDVFLEGAVEVADGGEATVTEAQLSTWKTVPAGRKGSGPSLRVAAGGAVSSAAVEGLGLLVGVGGNLRYSLDQAGIGPHPLLVASLSQAAGRPADRTFREQEFALVGGGGLEGFAGPFLLRAAGEAGAVAVLQAGTLSGDVFAVQPRLDAQVGAAYRLDDAWSVDLSITGGGMLVRTVGGTHVQPFVAALGGIGWGW
jgi:uncharacterized caspase-like protein